MKMIIVSMMQAGAQLGMVGILCLFVFFVFGIGGKSSGGGGSSADSSTGGDILEVREQVVYGCMNPLVEGDLGEWVGEWVLR